MLVTVGVQESLFESVLPPEWRRLPEELARIDALLDDPVFFEPFREFFHASLGRPSTPVEVYVRLMFLKFRYGFGYETLCREVGDSLTWRRFCRIPIEARMPHPTTLMKLTTRCGEVAVAGLNEALLAKATDAKVLRTTKLRVDTTVVPANVAYPTDSGLLARAIGRIAATTRRIQAAGGATRTRVRDRSRAAGRRAHAIGAKLRSRSALGRDEALASVRRTTGDLADLAGQAAHDADRLLSNAKRALRRARVKAAAARDAGEDNDPAASAAAGRRRGRLARAINDLGELLDATRQIAAQTRLRLSGQTPDAKTRRVSLHDPDARPIAKGRLGKPVEFGAKAQLVEGDDGVVVDHTLEPGNPADAPQLAPAVERVAQRAGKPPRTVTADRGYGEKRVDDALHDLGVTRVVIPRKGKPGAARRADEHQRAFRQTVKWRTGVEGRISTLKRGYGWDRTRIDGTQGARTWIGYGILAHNLVKISALTA